MNIDLLTALATLIGAFIAAVIAQHFFKKNSREKDLFESYSEVVSLRYRVIIDMTLRSNLKANIEYHRHYRGLTIEDDAKATHNTEQLRYISEQGPMHLRLQNSICDLIKQIAKFQIILGYEDPEITKFQAVLSSGADYDIQLNPKDKNELEDQWKREKERGQHYIQQNYEKPLMAMVERMKNIVLNLNPKFSTVENLTLIKRT